jgi:hypothetical protein
MGTEIQVAINVPSGKLVFDNDFREVFIPDWRETDNYDVNHRLGIKKTVEAYAKAGMFHPFVGNTCPGIWKESDTVIRIANPSFDENDVCLNDIPGKEVGSVCTDLWWVCVADLGEYSRRLGINNLPHDVDVVKVKPGRYIMTYDLEKDRDTRPCVFATIERSDEPLIEAKLPEEGIAEAVKAFLPHGCAPSEHNYQFVCCEPFYNREGTWPRPPDKYKIWGRIYDLDFADIFPTEDELNDPQALANELIAEAQRKHDEHARLMANLDRLKKRAESLTDEEKEEQERVAAEVLASLQKELKNLTNP